MVVAGLLGYEMINLVDNHPFDLNDFIATLIFGAISALIYARVLARYARNVNELNWFPCITNSGAHEEPAVHRIIPGIRHRGCSFIVG